MKDVQKYKDPNITNEELEALTKKMINAKISRDKKERWAEILENEHGVRRGAVKPGRRISLAWVAAAASILVLAVALFQLWNPNHLSATDQAMSYLQEEKILGPQTRKGAVEVEPLSQKAFEDYNTGNFQQAINLWKDIEDQGGMHVDDYFFNGMSHIHLGGYQAAIENFRQVRTHANGYPKYQQETTWMLALVLIKTGQTEEAKKELRQVIADGWRKDKAEKLLQILIKDSE